MNLTGRIRFRQSWTRSFVLEAEFTFMMIAVRYIGPGRNDPYPVAQWRDATAADIADLVSMGVLPSRQSKRSPNPPPPEDIRGTSMRGAA